MGRPGPGQNLPLATGSLRAFHRAVLVSGMNQAASEPATSCQPSFEPGPPPGWHLARAAVQVIICLAGQAPSRLRPLSSNVGLANDQLLTSELEMQLYLSAPAVAVLLYTGVAGAAEPGFGELPPGSVSTSETDDVTAEICRDHLFNPAAVTTTLPAGYRLTTAAEVASKDRALEALLLKNPKLRDYALGSLCFVSAGRLSVDGVSVQAVPPLLLAFWWAAAEGLRHSAMRGKTEWVQLGSWFSSTIKSQSEVLRTDPMAEFIDVQVEQADANRWRIRLALPNETVTAEVRTSGRLEPSRAQQPGYMSVPMSGRAADYFSVFTYFGHYHQAARGEWRATGTGFFSEAFSIEGEAEVFHTVFQAGWRARSGLYRFSSQ
jgi:hypothetical protein